MRKIKRRLYVDFDGVIVNSIKAICALYNDDFRYYKNFIPVKWENIDTWDFDELDRLDKKDIDNYFNQSRFFDTLEFMPYAKEVLEKLSKEYDIVIVSSGNSPNLRAKRVWLELNLPFVSFVGVNIKKHKDKSHIDMRGGIFIDDCCDNLNNSNADTKICFGDIYGWNENWNGIHRCYDWEHVENTLVIKW